MAARGTQLKCRLSYEWTDDPDVSSMRRDSVTTTQSPTRPVGQYSCTQSGRAHHAARPTSVKPNVPYHRPLYSGGGAGGRELQHHHHCAGAPCRTAIVRRFCRLSMACERILSVGRRVSSPLLSMLIASVHWRPPVLPTVDASTAGRKHLAPLAMACGPQKWPTGVLTTRSARGAPACGTVRCGG